MANVLVLLYRYNVAFVSSLRPYDDWTPVWDKPTSTILSAYWGLAHVAFIDEDDIPLFSTEESYESSWYSVYFGSRIRLLKMEVAVTTAD